MLRSNHSSPSNNDLSDETEGLLSRLHLYDAVDESRFRPLSTITYESFNFEGVEAWEGRNFALHPYGSEERRYHLPVADGDEARRQQIAHTYWTIFDRSVLPRPQAGSFLDFGTGAGYWVQDVASIFPRHKVIGIDLHYADRPETPENSEFEVDDCEAEFVLRSEPVSLINLRDSYFWVRDISHLVSQARVILRPGGHFQNQEFRPSHWESNKPTFNHWRQEVLGAAKNLGIQLHSADEVRNALGMAGFQDYQEREVTKHIDKSTDPVFFEFLRLTVQATFRILVMGRSTTPGETLTQLAEVSRELDEQDCRVAIQLHSCWAKK